MDPESEAACKRVGGDQYSLSWLKTAVEEVQPDLVVFSGDQFVYFLSSPFGTFDLTFLGLQTQWTRHFLVFPICHLKMGPSVVEEEDSLYRYFRKP